MTIKPEVMAAMGKLRSLSKRDGVSEANRECVEIIRAELLAMDASLAEAVRDAELWRYLVRENNKGGRGAFRIVWFDEGDDGFTTTDGVSVDGKDDQAIIRIVSDAMHNSARDVE